MIENTHLLGIQKLCRLIQSNGSRTAGNISFREDNTFRITKSGSCLDIINKNDFVLPKPENNPSCEVKIHEFIYETRPDVDWIVHLHDDVVLKNPKGLPITEKYAKFGTQELVDEIAKVLNQENYLVIRNHGIIALGSTLEETIDLITKIHNACKNNRVA